jgi:cell division protein FtsI/penicillin-binding protein 2
MVVVDPGSGRVLTVVNQQLAFGNGYQPCSTFKPAVALAALEERLIEEDRTRLQLGKRWYMGLQDALAMSNNVYFAKLGQLLGLEKLREYAHRFGFGEPAGLGIEQEPEGALPNQPPPARQGGVGKVASFGQGISMTMFQLASFISAVANGGTLYYLQYPRNAEAAANFEPKVKRELQIASQLSLIQQGMGQAVLTGTARKARQPDFTVLGKTGTCSQGPARLGWFGGYSHREGGLAVVVLLRSGKSLGGGGGASEVAGRFFRSLADQNYVAESAKKELPSAPPAAIQLPSFP